MLASISRAPTKRKALLILLAAAVICVAGLGVFVASRPVLDGVNRLREGTTASVGLGIFPIAVWVAAFALALAFRRSWLVAFNLWIAAAAVAVALTGVFAFFRPLAGPLAWFTDYGYSTLGGSFGDAVIGSPNLFGGVRVFALLALAFAAALPSVAFDLSKIAGQWTIFAYMTAFMGIRSLLPRSRAEDAPAIPIEDLPDAGRDRPGAIGDRWRDGLDASPGVSSLSRRDRWARDYSAPYSGGMGDGPDLSRRSRWAGEFGAPYSGASAEEDFAFPTAATLSGDDGVETVDGSAPDGGELTFSEVDTLSGDDGDENRTSELDESTLPEIPGFLNGDGERSVSGETAPSVDDVDAPWLAARRESSRPMPGKPVPVMQPGIPWLADTVELDVEDVYEPSAPQEASVASGEFGRDRVEGGPKSNRYWMPEDKPVSAAAGRAGRFAQFGESAPRINASGLLWERPPIELFKDAPENPISGDEVERTANTIMNTLGEYGVEVEVGQVRPGPTVTMYGLVPGWVRRNRVVKETDEDGHPILNEKGRQISRRVEQKTRVKVDAILAREKDLSLALKTPSIRIETPAMGKSLVGIEVPNPNPSMVTLRNVMSSNEFQKMRKDAHLPVALGRGSGGESVCFDLAKMPHLLVAGATGSGKSVCLNAIVSCLITEKTPVEARLLLVDPKRVELTPYNGVPHLMAPVIVETDTVVGYLKGLIREMFNRYRLMEEMGVRNIEAYNKRSSDRMPYLCVVVDELADLMMTAAFDVEQSLCRLAQLGRATGIHLIIATQRPSVDVVTGLIKANFPSRISFGVTSQVDSRTILDTSGADKLLGRGDMLYLPLDASKPSRVQSVFIGDEEIGDLVNFWQSKPWPPIREIDLLGGEEFDDESAAAASSSDPDRDDMLNKAIELAQTHRKFSTSLLQRRLRIGYPRAARLMDQLEEEGIVGPADGAKSRDVIMNQNS